MKKYLKTLTFLLLFLNFISLGSLIVEGKDVIMGGNTIGIELKKEGLVISGTYDLYYSGKNYNPKYYLDIDKGDLLINLNNKKIKNSNDYKSVINNLNSDFNEVDIVIKKDDELLNEKIYIIKEEGVYRSGLLIKERLLALGTLTYVDPENNTYGALGHEIYDEDNKEIYEDFQGKIVQGEIDKIVKSENGDVGEKIGKLDFDKEIGDVLINNNQGIYGKYNDKLDNIVLRCASISEVKLGKAKIATVIEDDKVELFDIKITHLDKFNKNKTKGITFEVTDKKLLEKTNGIVQGMSGSPLIQDNLLIGACSHVLTNNVHKGYGIYIEHMLSNSDSILND